MWLSSFNENNTAPPLNISISINKSKVDKPLVTRKETLYVENKFLQIKQLTDRYINVVTRTGTDEFQNHFDYLLYVIQAIEQGNYKEIYYKITQPTLNSNTHNSFSFLKKKFVIPMVKNPIGRPRGRKPMNCFSKTKNNKQIIINKIIKNIKNQLKETHQ